MKNALTVAEARRQLPRLLQEIARGGGPFYVGPRGQAVAVLVSVADHSRRDGRGRVGEGLGAWEGLRLEIVGDPELVADDVRAIRRESITSTLDSWESRKDPVAPRPRPRKRRKAGR